MALAFNDSNFQDEVLQSEVPVLVDFYADWCGPCKMMGPVIEDLATQYEGQAKIGKLNVDESGAIAQKYGVMNIPTMLLIKNGEVVDKVIGAVPKQKLEETLKKVL